MKHLGTKYMALSAIFILTVSCMKEEDPFSTMRQPNSEETIFGDGLPSDELLNFMNIRVDDVLSAKLERSTDDAGNVSLDCFKSLKDQGVVRMRRLFPEAGRFEERTRAEGLHLWYVLEYNPRMSMTKAAEKLIIEGVDIIEYCPRISIVGNPQIVEQDFSTKASVSDVFNDPMLEKQWHYYNNGTAVSSVSGCDINVLPVWRNYSSYYKYKKDVVVSIVDGGVDYSHEDLKDNMWRNPDKSGDNVYGYNFASSTYNIHPESHGTHVAGTVAAVNNNGKGVCGVAGGNSKGGIPGAKLMSCQIFDGDKQGSGAEAIKWGADHGAVISQNSWSYPTLDTTPASVKAAVDYFVKYAGIDENGNQTGPMKGGLVVFAAGNEGKSTSSNDYSKILCVSSVGADYKRAYYTCYGDYCDVSAPGGDAKKGNQVMSTLPGNKYGQMQGTSMACPHVSGLAALALQRFGGDGYTAEALRKQIEDNVTDISSQNPNYYLGKGLINAYRTVAGSGGKAPDKPTNLSVTTQSNNIHFSVTIPADSDDGVPNSIYICYSTSDFTSASKAMFGMFYVEDLKAGDTISGTIGGTEFNTEYYVAAMACDLSGNKSGLTARLKVTTGENSAPEIKANSPLSYVLKPHEKAVPEFEINEPDGHFYYIELDGGSEAAVLDTLVREKPKIRITAANAPTGKYKAVMTVADVYGSASSVSVDYEILENHKPEVVSGIDNIIFDSKAAVTKEIDTESHFYDEDWEELSYSFTFSNESVVNMTYSKGKFLLTPMGYGICEITVTGTDVRGENVSLSFKVLVRDGAKELVMFPNPVSDWLNIRLSEETEELVVSLVSSAGSEVFRDTFRNVSPFDPVRVDMSGIVPGCYTAVVAFNGKELKTQIVKL
ncbi:MAG: S8 family serine peptidase [Candidatus Cryptobacteroides sp.]